MIPALLLFSRNFHIRKEKIDLSKNNIGDGQNQLSYMLASLV